MESKDYYKLLGVSKDATKDEISKAYKKLALKYHPDRQVGKSEQEKKEAEEKFKEISEAAEVLTNDDKRKQYDQFGTVNGSGMNGFGDGGASFDPFSFFRSHFQNTGFDSMFGDSPFGFSSHFGRSQHNMQDDFNSPEDGNSIQTNLQVKFHDIVFGCTAEFDFNATEECKDCHGTGVEAGTTPTQCTKCNGTGQVVSIQHSGMMVMQQVSMCPVCHGTGMSYQPCKKCKGNKRLHAIQHISVRIPAGIDSGQKLRVKGKGECGIKGGSNGDLYINIIAEKSDIFEKNGLDLYTVLHLNPITATIGGNIDIQTPYGSKTIHVNPGTQSGKLLKIVNHGIKTNTMSGDLYLKVKIEPLININSQQKSLLENLSNMLNDSNVANLQEYKTKMKKFKQS